MHLFLEFKLSKGGSLPEFTASAEAMIPSYCLDSITCEQCIKETYGKLQSARKRLARLKCFGNSTKDFVSKSISFGDQVSGIHAIQGLAWQKEKKVINETYDTFKTTYDIKYKELMDKLTESLQAIDECESTHGQKDWFQRYGFMYVEFMADRYKRLD